ncbi:MAG: hypothetical protein HY903_21095 [Deltaproteobacteria bacterium]|nr:hypothetical protein [Deltaproteobacteria bacterium]
MKQTMLRALLWSWGIGLTACVGEASLGEVGVGDTTLTLARLANGDLQYCDASGACTALPYGGACQTLLISIDSSTGTTCQQCTLDNGDVLDQGCDASAVVCEVIEIPDPDCMVCAYVNGAVVHSSCAPEASRCSADADCVTWGTRGRCVDGQCVPVTEPSCDRVTCYPGSHCELQQVECFRAPCPPLPTCVPDPLTCDNVICVQGTHCEMPPTECFGTPCPPRPACVPDPTLTCDNVTCVQGTHCEMRPTECFAAPCPLWPVCVPDGCALTAAGCPRPVVTVTGAGNAHGLEPYFLGLNGNNFKGPGWTDAELIDGVRAAAPATLRLPGGTVGNYYDWTKVSGQGHGWLMDRLAARGADVPFANGVPEFKYAIDNTQTTPLFMLNLLTYRDTVLEPTDQSLLTAQLDWQLKMLGAADRVGMPVELVELGNELYLPGVQNAVSADGDSLANDNRTRFPTVAEYVRTANRFATAVKARFPAARLAAVGALGKPGWTQSVLDGVDKSQVAAVTLHYYVPLRDAGLAGADPYARAFFLVHDSWAAARQAIATIRSQQRKVWFTEYNTHDLSTGSEIAGTWAHALTVASMTLRLIGEQGVEMAVLHNVLGEPNYRVVRTGPGPTLTLSGTVFAAIAHALRFQSGSAARFANVARPLALSDAAWRDPDGNPAAPGAPGFPALQAVVVKSSGLTTRAARVIGVNLGNESQQLQIDSVCRGGATWDLYSAPGPDSRATPTVASTTETQTGSVSLPAFSLFVLSCGGQSIY